jgi:hypothetical protein
VAGVASSGVGAGVGAGVGGSAAAPPTAELGPDLDALGAALSASRVVPQLVFADGSTRTSGLERPGARGWAGGGEVTGPIAIAASMLLLVVIGLMVQVGGSASHAPRRIGVMRAALA